MNYIDMLMLINESVIIERLRLAMQLEIRYLIVGLKLDTTT